MRRFLFIVFALALAGAAFLHGAPQNAPAKTEKTDNLGNIPAPSPAKEDASDLDSKGDKGPKASGSKPGDRLWSAVVFATNSSNPNDIPSELKSYERRLKRVFGYNQFKLVGTASSQIVDRADAQLTPGERFSLNYRARRANSKEARGGYLLSLQLLHDDKSIVDTETKLAPGSPLFIRGPQCGNGHLLIVLQVDR